MSSQYVIEAPQTLASLPRPFSIVNGATTAGQVYNLKGHLKRKRGEIVAGIDGEALNIYSIKTPRLITSYPTPPNSHFTSPPTCLYVPAEGRKNLKRYTYASVRSDLNASKHNIICHEERISKPPSAGIQTKHECELGSQTDPVVAIDTINGLNAANGVSPTPYLVAVTASGQITVKSADLKRSIAITQLREDSHSSPLHVEHVSIQSSLQARKGILKSRLDLLALLASSSTATDGQQDSELLLIITRPSDSDSVAPRIYTLHLLTLRRQSAGSSHLASFQTVEQWPLPTTASTRTCNVNAKFAVETSCGTLYQLSGSTLLVFEPATMLRLARQFRLSEYEYQLLPITKHTLLLTNHECTVIYDTKYGSLYAVRTIQADSAALSSPRKKRKRNTASVAVHSSSVSVLDYHAKLNTVLALVGRDLVAIHLTIPRIHKAPAESRLIDSLGRGFVSGPQTEAIGLTPDKGLELLVRIKVEESFEKLFFTLVEQTQTADPTAMYRYRNLAIKALAAMFDWSQNASVNPLLDRHTSSIKITFCPKNAMQWVTVHGYLSPGNITKALYENRPSPKGSLPTVTPIDMVAAIANHDPSLEHLETVISHTQLDLSAWLESLRHLITSFDAPGRGDHALLTSTTDEMDMSPPQSPQLITAQDEDDPAALALKELDLTLTALSRNTYQSRSKALNITISHLSLGYSPKALIPALRSQLQRREILLLIDLLRIELESSGWTTRRLDFYPRQYTEKEYEIDRDPIALITKLLNACLDALTVGAWLSAPSQSTEDNTLCSLRDATNVILEAAQESAFFANFLTDFLRFEGAVKSAAADYERVAPLGGEGVQRVRLARGVEGSMLPLGRGSVEAVDMTRVGAGGEVTNRSRRDMQRKMSRRVGIYEFERLGV